MTKAEAIEFVTKLLRDLLVRSEVDDIPVITPTSQPIGDLGLESKDGVDWICDVEDELAIEIDGKENPFLDEGRARPNNVDQIADWVLRVSEEVKSNA